MLLRVLFSVVALAGAARSATPQNLSADPRSAELFEWSEAVRLWQRSGDSASLRVARGVLFSCAGHSAVGASSFGPNTPVAGVAGCAATRLSGCREEAERDFARAVSLDPSLIEPRLRLAWSRVERGVDDAVRELEVIADTPQVLDTFRYLAAMFRATAAWNRRDETIAIKWYEKAGAVSPQFGGASLALAIIRPLRTTTTAAVPGNDPWYAYPCSILTVAIDAELSKRRALRPKGAQHDSR